MAKNVYACLLGEWVNLSADESATIGEDMVSPYIWYKENAVLYAPFNREEANTYYQLDYVNIQYQGKNYRINPIFIQIVEE